MTFLLTCSYYPREVPSPFRDRQLRTKRGSPLVKLCTKLQTNSATKRESKCEYSKSTNLFPLLLHIIVPTLFCPKILYNLASLGSPMVALLRRSCLGKHLNSPAGQNLLDIIEILKAHTTNLSIDRIFYSRRGPGAVPVRESERDLRIHQLSNSSPWTPGLAEWTRSRRSETGSRQVAAIHCSALFAGIPARPSRTQLYTRDGSAGESCGPA